MNKTYYDEKLETLPENLQYAISMSNWEESLVQIQTQFKLHIDQTQVLEDCTMKLMFGDIDAPDFISHMFGDAHINSEMAADILLEVDLKILKKIREDLVDMDEGDKEEEEIENFLLEDEEKEARAENEAYAKYYAELDKIREEDDASPEDEEEVIEEVIEDKEIPINIPKEKDDLLNEINKPTKSFTIDLTKNQPSYQPLYAQPAPLDHRLENTHLEKPYQPKDIIPVNIPTMQDQKFEIKKPITINLDDVYREPLE